MKRRRILFDARFLAGRTTGMGRYVTNVLREFAALAPDDLEVQALALHDDAIPEGIALKRLRLPLRCLPGHSLQQALLPWVIVRSGCDLYHYPLTDPPLCLGRPLVATCPDLEPLRFPDLFPRRIVRFYRMLSRGLRRARRVIVISANSGRDLADLVGVHPARIVVAYLGVEPRFGKALGAGSFRDIESRYSLPPRYVLYVGNTMPHKNLARLARAMAIVRRRQPGVALVFAGRRDRYRPALEKEIEVSGMSRAACFLDDVPDADLPALYARAAVFAYPSLCEGFGLPALEAMACGTPVVTSNVSSLPEIVGDAGVLVDPRSVEALAEAIGLLLENSERAASLREKGRKRAATFTWRRCAESHLGVYRDVLALRRTS